MAFKSFTGKRNLLMDDTHIHAEKLWEDDVVQRTHTAVPEKLLVHPEQTDLFTLK